MARIAEKSIGVSKRLHRALKNAKREKYKETFEELLWRLLHESGKKGG